MGTTNFNKIGLKDVTLITTANATATASGTTVDPTEFAALVALANACKAKINEIITG